MFYELLKDIFNSGVSFKRPVNTCSVAESHLICTAFRNHKAGDSAGTTINYQ